MKKLQLVERIVIKPANPIYKQIDGICFAAKNLYNSAIYRNRQIYFTNQMYDIGTKLESYVDQARELKNTADYKALPAKVSQHVLKLADKAWKGYFQSLKSYYANPKKFKARPNPPGYLDKITGRQIAVYTTQAMSKTSLDNGYVKLSGCSFEVKSKIVAKSIQNPSYYEVNQTRLVPRQGYYVLEVVYTRYIPLKHNSPYRFAAIDLGVNRLSALVTNGKLNPCLVNGKPIKSINQYYNKKVAKLKSELSKSGCGTSKSSKQIKAFYRRRDAKINHYLHTASRRVIEYCLKHKISTLFIGKNNGWKQNINLGKKNNQNFCCLPLDRFVSMLQYKAEKNSIEVKFVHEAYTSKASSLDNDRIPELGAKKPKFLGKRLKRGLYKTFSGILLNADVNAALNILRKGFEVFKIKTFQETCRVTQHVAGFVVSPVMLAI